MDQSSLKEAQRSFLRIFFGYLTSALCFLHDNRIRRKDIKPQNVLVKAHHVLLTDFGVSLDWTDLGNSTTSGPTPLTPRYCGQKYLIILTGTPCRIFGLWDASSLRCGLFYGPRLFKKC